MWNFGDKVSKDGGRTVRTIIGVNGTVVVLSGTNHPDYASPNFTQAELERKGYRLVPAVVTKTVAQIERELGMAPGTLHVTK